MNYPFQMYGNTVQLYHYRVDYTLSKENEDEETVIKTEYFVTEEEAQLIKEQHIGAILTPLDTSKYDWIDNLEVPQSSNPMVEAMKIFDLGEEGYKQKLLFDENKRNEQLRADIDYIMLMGGLV